MSRIRTIKPELFRHEKLQDLQSEHPNSNVMLVFIGLFTQADKNGIFPYKPRSLKLDILPFLEFDINATLTLLLANGFIKVFESDGDKYGFIPAFTKHQVLGTKEKESPAKYPVFKEKIPTIVPEQSQNSPDTVTEFQERNKGRDIGKGEWEGSNAHAREGGLEPVSETDQMPETTKMLQGAPPPESQEVVSGPWRQIKDAVSPDGFRELRDIASLATYNPETHGPVSDELVKFCSHYADNGNFTADPVKFFRQKFTAWLINAKSMNRPNKPKPSKNGQGPPKPWNVTLEMAKEICRARHGGSFPLFADRDYGWPLQATTEEEFNERLAKKALEKLQIGQAERTGPMALNAAL